MKCKEAGQLGRQVNFKAERPSRFDMELRSCDEASSCSTVLWDLDIWWQMLWDMSCRCLSQLSKVIVLHLLYTIFFKEQAKSYLLKFICILKTLPKWCYSLTQVTDTAYPTYAPSHPPARQHLPRQHRGVRPESTFPRFLDSIRQPLFPSCSNVQLLPILQRHTWTKGVSVYKVNNGQIFLFRPDLFVVQRNPGWCFKLQGGGGNKSPLDIWVQTILSIHPPALRDPWPIFHSLNISASLQICEKSTRIGIWKISSVCMWSLIINISKLEKDLLSRNE